MSLWIFSPVLKGMLPRIDLKKALEALQAQAQEAQAQVAQAQKGPGSQTQIALGQILKKGQAQKACYREIDVWALEALEAQAQVAQAQKGPGSQTQIALSQILKKGQAQNSPKVYAREKRPRPHVEFEGDGVRKHQDSTTRRVYADGRASAEPDRHVKIFSEKS